MTALIHHYRLTPTAPLVFGTGKPMDFGLGGDTLGFPRPSTMAGAFRAAAAAAAGRVANPFDDQTSSVRVGAPLLLRRTEGRTPADTLYLPRPLDAPYFSPDAGSGFGNDGFVDPLVPSPSRGGFCDAPEGLQLPGLLKPTRAKPASAPHWWTLQMMKAWLTRPAAACMKVDGAHRNETLGALGIASRTHVVIEPVSQVAKAGGLFRSSGVDFGGRRSQVVAGQLERFGIVASTTCQGLAGSHRRVGGEGRVAHLSACDDPLPNAPWLTRLDKGQVIRLVLISPGIFPQGGWRPCWIDARTLEGRPPGDGAPLLRLLSAQIDRPIHFSGWSESGAGAPMRGVPAGAVYWFELPEGGDPKALWNRSLCSGTWAAAGWGFALVGTA